MDFGDSLRDRANTTSQLRAESDDPAAAKNRQAPKGPHVSSRRFQPADRMAEQMTPTPAGLTKPQSGPFRAAKCFRLISVGFTHGYSWVAPSGQTAFHCSQ
jgi:hypothetical protein